MLPRGIRNNNPLNIRIGNKWVGEVKSPTDPSFEQFSCMPYGLRAAFIILRRYIEVYKLNTISKIVSRYYKSIVNCFKASKYADRTYVYDNTAENTEAQILFRMIDGKLAKQYLSELPKWSEPILGIM